MKKITKSELQKILDSHKKWLNGEAGGTRANLYGASLDGASLVRASLDGASLVRASLDGANLYGASLVRASLDGASLVRASLVGASLVGASLVGANLYGASLDRASLVRASLDRANLPPPTVLLLCNWGKVSDKLTTELMRYDAANHPKPHLFQEWADGGDCPYAGRDFPRVAHFQENRELWKTGKAKSARELILMLFAEKGIKFDEGI